jgi:hypothetical protein
LAARHDSTSLPLRIEDKNSWVSVASLRAMGSNWHGMSTCCELHVCKQQGVPQVQPLCHHSPEGAIIISKLGEQGDQGRQSALPHSGPVSNEP